MSEKTKRTEEWIQITDPDGKRLIASPSYIRKMLGLDLTNVFNRLQRLERHVDRLEAPGRQEKILQLLHEHGKHNRTWIDNRVSDFQWYDMSALLEKGLIVTSKAGSVTMYSCAGDNL